MPLGVIVGVWQMADPYGMGHSRLANGMVGMVPNPALGLGYVGAVNPLAVGYGAGVAGAGVVGVNPYTGTAVVRPSAVGALGAGFMGVNLAAPVNPAALAGVDGRLYASPVQAVRFEVLGFLILQSNCLLSCEL